ncbi:nuclear transport factor 2 family protein [Sphingomonas sp. G-3-2-10]|uniref:YybH family protein n=1 Tax=Sphingomonas sp. G-3-2-10 TaxID=2728838 RepID=UPI00146ECB82|nr:nuclear transport factor 2 family protein [Sphingomonas sp. G-3-2-10]NML04706.1 nuclear transport factor 2 family protein [Sphingomonas sp. G-3-2-10]
MLRWLLISLALVFALPAAAQDPRTAIEAGMADSAAGWDAGNVDRFLAIYSDDPATSFTTEKGIARGKPAVRARYLSGYPEQFGPNRGAGATRLSFTFEDFRMLGTDHALLTARWKLVDAGGKELTGMTTLVFRRETTGWKIIADHSS